MTGPVDSVQELHAELAIEPRPDTGVAIQSCGFLLDLSPDWIVRRASENVRHLLGESHVTLIDEPLGRFVHAQALHDLRNLFSRLSGTTGIGRAYAIRLTEAHDYVDLAFQLNNGRVLLEAVPTTGSFGECFGSVGGLIDGLSRDSGQRLLDNAARRMRALTGFDQVTLTCGDMRAESNRGGFGQLGRVHGDLPMLVSDTDCNAVSVFPRRADERSLDAALMRLPDRRLLDDLRAAGIRSSLRVPFRSESATGEFRCLSRKKREPNFELHAAAELFAQMFGMRLALERRANG
jgi:PAS domain-containing protein